MDLKVIDKSKLEPGDIIGVLYNARIGWGSFRYQKVVPKRIKRITPARTKFITEDGCDYGKYDWFYEVDEEAKRQTIIAEYAENISNKLYEIEELRKQGKLYGVSDDKIIRVSDLLDEIVKELTEDNQK